MSDVFHEVDEELRRQQLDKVFKTYGPWVAALVIVVLAGYGGFTFWQSYQASRASGAADQLVHGMEEAAGGDIEGAEATFAALAEDGPAGYAMLAEFQEAALTRQNGDSGAAVAMFDEIAADGSNPAVYRNLARYYAGLTAISDPDMSYEEIASRLQPVAEGDSPWRYHAREALGYVALRESDRARAEEIYRGLTEDALTPSGVAARANEMLNVTLAEEDAAAPATETPAPTETETDAATE